MADYGNYLDRIAALKIDERVAHHRAGTRPRRPRGRHALADRLHHLADRIDR